MTDPRPETARCGDELIHDEHVWETHEQPDSEDAPDCWASVDRFCVGNLDQDDPLFRYECCEHCGSPNCPRRDGHHQPCETRCSAGSLMLGAPFPSPVPVPA